MAAIIEIIIIYILSVITVWRFMKIAHSKDGRWYNLNTGVIEVFFTLCPIVNTIMAIGSYISGPYKNENCNKFFNIKKDK